MKNIEDRQDILSQLYSYLTCLQYVKIILFFLYTKSLFNDDVGMFQSLVSQTYLVIGLKGLVKD